MDAPIQKKWSIAVQKSMPAVQSVGAHLFPDDAR